MIKSIYAQLYIYILGYKASAKLKEIPLLPVRG